MDRTFRVNLERSRVYWDYYKNMFLVFCGMLMVASLAAVAIYHKGGFDLIIALGLVSFFFLCIILLAALMSLIIWRHENRFFEEMLKQDSEEEQEQQEGKGELV